MDQQEITARNMVDRYVRGELSEEELYEFEEYYFEHQEVLKDIALTEVMREALRAAPRPRPAEAVESWPQRLLGYISTPKWSLGATTAAVVLAGVLIVEALQGPRVGDSRPRSASVMPVVAELSLVRMRGAQGGAPPVVQIKAPGAVSIAIDTAGMEPAILHATLHGPEKDIELPPLTPDPTLGVATVAMPTQLLAPGSYVLELHDARGSNIAYKFEIVP
jgi:anti-sigma factor RsiW